MKYRNGKDVECGDICLIYPVRKKFPYSWLGLGNKGSITTIPYYVYIKI